MSENIIGQIFKDHFFKMYNISEFEYKVINNIINCRTEIMGERVEKCDHCGHEIRLFNSCRNRNCPNCQGTQAFKWLRKRLDEALPVNYFHGVFTIPQELKHLFLYNKVLCLKILFKSASRTLQQVAKKNHKIKIGFISILHTWDQQLNFHPHIHCVIAGGGLNQDKTKWIEIKNKNYLLPKKILSKVFRGKVLFYLNKAFRNNKIKIDRNEFVSLCSISAKKDWGVYLKRSMGGVEQVLKYLSLYTHRIAISNHRIKNYDGKIVTFTYRDRKDQNKQKILSLPADLFIRRFILHIVPKRFVKIRFYGFMVNRLRKKIIPICKEFIAIASKSIENILPPLSALFTEYSTCPICKKGLMKIVKQLEDTS